MDRTDWNILDVLYKNKNITITAETLYMSQPAISYRLQGIEKDFGIKLYYKDNNGITFTSEGEYLVQYARDMLKHFDKVKNNIANLGNEIKGEIRLGVSNNFAVYKLPSALKEFKTLYPKVYIEIVTGYSKDIKKMMDKGEIHVGIVKGSYEWKGKKYLLQEEKNYIISKFKIDLSLLPSYPRIEYNADPLFKQKVDSWWKKEYGKNPNNIMKVDKVEICKRMVDQELGFAIIPGICLDDSKDFYTHALYMGAKPIVRDIWLYAHEKHSYITSVRTIINFLITFQFDN